MLCFVHCKFNLFQESRSSNVLEFNNFNFIFSNFSQINILTAHLNAFMFRTKSTKYQLILEPNDVLKFCRAETKQTAKVQELNNDSCMEHSLSGLLMWYMLLTNTMVTLLTDHFSDFVAYDWRYAQTSVIVQPARSYIFYDCILLFKMWIIMSRININEQYCNILVQLTS